MEAGDRVRIESGSKGTIVILNDERTLAYVRLDEHKDGVRLTLCAIDALVKIGDAN
jgi:preprotein translocase subunit YajC